MISLLVATVAVAAAVVGWPQLQRLTARSRRDAPPQPEASARVLAAKPVPPPPSKPLPRVTPESSTAAADPAPPPPAAAPVRSEVDPAAEHRDDVSMAEPEPTNRPTTSPDPASAAADVTTHLTDAITALRGHRFDDAQSAIDAAAEDAGDGGQLATRVDRWRLLLDYARQLDGYVAKAIASANAGRDYTIGDRTIAIIEIGPTTFAYKERGRIVRGRRADLPRAVERAVLTGWFDGDGRAANHIFLGVHRLLDQKPDLVGVGREWQTAADGEPAARSILPLLDDPALAAHR